MTPDKIGVALTYENMFWMVDAQARARLAVPKINELIAGVDDLFRLPPVETSYKRIMSRVNTLARGRERIGKRPRLWLTPTSNDGVWR